MKNKKTSLLFALAATFVLSICASVGGLSKGAGAQEALGEAVLIGGAIEEEYLLGEYLNVPSAKLTCGNETKDARVIVKKPNGELVQTTNVALLEGGIYTVEYRAVFGGKVKTVEKNFTVQTPVFLVQSKNSSAVYGEDSSQYQTGIKGVNVDLAEGDILTYNDVIDLKASEGDFLEFILPPTDGPATNDLRKLVVTLTDFHDPSISLTVVVQCAKSEGEDKWYYDYTYVQAGGQNQTPAGFEAGTGKTHVGNEWGAPTRFSFYGMHGSNVSVGTEKLKLTYSEKDNTVYANGMKVIRLDDLNTFEEAWKGFTTGEVKMTIKGDKYSRPCARLLITRIGINNLNQTILVDEKAPEINVDYAGYSEDTLPSACKGYSYPVFNAKGMDNAAGAVPVKTTVYYGYNSEQRFQVEVVDGKFKTDRLGYYTIEYSAVDNYGNVGKKAVTIECTADSADITVAPQGVYTTTVKTGELLFPADIAYEGGTGIATTWATVKTPDGTEISLKNGYRPEEAATHTVILYVTDILGKTATYTYDVEVTVNTKPVFLDDVVLPKFFLSGYNYTLPTLSAYDYSSGVKEIATTISVKDGAGERVLKDGVGNFTADENGYATISYNAIGSKGLTQKQYQVPVVATGMEEDSLDMTTYFYGENLTKVATNNSIKIGSTTSTEYHFINPVIAHKFNMQFSITGNAFECLQLIFTDSKDATRQFTVEIEKSSNPDENALLKINGIATRERPSAGFYGNSLFSFSYDELGKTIQEGALLKQAIKNADGSLFEGFSSDLMYVSVRMIGVEGTAELEWKNFGGQTLSKMDMDMIKPLIALSQDYQSSYEYKSVCEIYPAISVDVLCPETINSLTVYDPNGDIVKDINGMLLSGVSFAQSYFVQLDYYGSYSVVYTAKDLSGRTQTYYAALFVADNEEPIISLQGEVKSQIKLGEKIKIVSAFAVDNVDENVAVYTYLVDPDGIITSVENGGSVVATKKGVYQIRYMSIDSFGNYKLFTVQVTVV